VTLAAELAEFVVGASWKQLSEPARDALKIRVLDSLGCAIGALDGDAPRKVREQVDDFGGKPRCTLIGGGRSAPDLAALYNGALVRYLDFNDSYLAPGETCHPSDNLAPVLAAAEYAGASGRDLLVALGVAYQVQCRLSDVAPVRARGFDHTVQGAYAAAAGVSKALGLDAGRTTHAVAIAGTALNALRVTRTGRLSHWKGLAYPYTAFGATHGAFLAMRGITAPSSVFEGNKGFMETIAGQFTIDWAREGLDAVIRTILKRYNAEIHSQSALEAILELKEEHGLAAGDVDRIDLEVFDVAFNIIGGGEEGDKTLVTTKEEADHSLNYMVAVALLDGQVMPEQYEPGRIARNDVQELLRRVHISPDPDLSARFPEEHGCRLQVRLRNGAVVAKQKRGYEGFVTRPMRWETVVEKFERLSHGHAGETLRKEIVGAVEGLDSIDVKELMSLLERVQVGSGRDGSSRRRNDDGG
jgi:2-methylcitrate dehydratase